MKTTSCLAFAAVLASTATGTTLLYTQDFENPTGFVNDGGDVNIYRTVNQLYGNQPPGFQFAQTYTTETLLVGGTQAWGVGFQDPQNRAGRYVLGQLSDVQNDILSLSFNVGAYKFLNLQLDISSIDLDRWGGPFVPYTPQGSAVPQFRFSLYDNPGGAVGGTSGAALASADVSGLSAANQYTFNWTNHVVALDATGNTNGNVTLRIDMLAGGYGAMDNLRIASSDTEGDVGQPVPDGGTGLWLGATLVFLAAARRARNR